MKLYAYCSSNGCKVNKKRKGPQMTLKEGVSKHTDYCPDCSNALFWTSDIIYRNKQYYKTAVGTC